MLHEAVRAMDSKATIQCNKLMQLENSMLMYGIYNSETLEKLINTVHSIHNTTSSHERLFAGQQGSLTLRSLYANTLGLHHYSINSSLYLRTIQDNSECRTLAYISLVLTILGLVMVVILHYRK